jgi:hypothetical protein
MPAANERHRRAQRRQRRGVVGTQHQVPPVRRNDGALALRMRAPEHEHHRARPFGHVADDGVGQYLPALARVAGGLALFHRERGVEQQHAVRAHLHQTAAGLRKGGRRRAQVALQFLEDVAQRGRQRHAGRHRKRQPLGLAPAVVGVLPQDDHAHLVGRREFQRAQRARRKDGGPGLEPRLQKAQQLAAHRSLAKNACTSGCQPGATGQSAGSALSSCVGALVADHSWSKWPQSSAYP